MKKYFLLTSLLALTACGGGSGGGHHNGSVPFAPGGDAVRAAVTQEVIDSNKQITSMASEILVPQGGSGDTLVRSGTTSINGQIYKSYRLDDVNFKIGGEDSLIKFEVDDKGQIIALTKMDRSDDFSGDPTYAKSQEGTFTRTSSTGKDFSKSLFVYGYNLTTSGDTSLVQQHFNGDLQIMDDTANLASWQIKQKVRDYINKEINKIKESQTSNDYDEEIETARAYYLGQVDGLSFSAPQEVHATVTAEGVNIGLKYADLGFAELMVKDNTDTNTVEHAYSPYVGGYGALKVDPAALTNDTTFSGTAIAGLDRKTVVNNETIEKEGVLVRDDNATLTMHSNGASELAMNNLTVVHTDTSEAGLMGKKWYDVTAKQNADGTPTFIVTGTNAVTNYDLPSGVTSASGITFAANEFRPTEQEYAHNIGVANPGEGTRYGGNMETAMYGPNSVASEATARFGFSNEVYSNGNADHQEVAIYGAFGGTKQ